MVFTAGLSFILFTFTSYNSYDRAQVGAVQAAQARLAEGLQLRSCDSSVNQLPAANPFFPLTCSGADVSVWIQNTGGVSVTLVGMWIVDSTTGATVVQPQTPPSPQTNPAFPDTVGLGSTAKIDTSHTLPSGLGADKFSITFLTSTGNQFAATYPPPPLPNVAPTITTTLSQIMISPGGSVYDTALLSGVTGSASGTVTYTFYSGSSCAGFPLVPPTMLNGLVVTVTNGNVPNSPSETFSPAGSYSWHAVFSGDTNNAAATSPCEPLTVGSSISTTLSSAFIVQGTSVTDTATLSGANSPTGSITFYYSTSNTCPNSGATTVGSFPISGSSATSSSVTLLSGAYYWYATYLGDANNPGPVTSACELLIVQSPGGGGAKVTPTLTTAATSPVRAGQPASDTATLSSGNLPTGIIVFAAYGPSPTPVCTGSPAFTSNPVAVSVSGNPSPPTTFTSSPNFLPSAVGSYYWVVFYTGDSANNPVTTACGASGETLVVTKATPTITTSLSSTSILQGQSASDTATLVGSSGSNAVGTMTFFFSTRNECPSTTSHSGVGTATGGTATTLTDTSKSWTVNEWAGFTVTITAGTGSGQSRTVVSNTANALTVSPAWSSPPDVTSVYSIGSTSSPVVNGVAISSSFQFSALGTFYWYAAYSGDPNNNAATWSGPCESLKVTTIPVCQPGPGTTCFALTSQGLGYLSFDFSHVLVFTAANTGGGGSCPRTGPGPGGGLGCTINPAGLTDSQWIMTSNDRCALGTGMPPLCFPNAHGLFATLGTPPNAYGAYSILINQASGAPFYVIALNMTNVDPFGRDITLSSSSELVQFSAPPGSSSSTKDFVFTLARFDDLGNSMGPGPVTLPACDFNGLAPVCFPQWIFFAASFGTGTPVSTTTILANFLYLFGSLSKGGSCLPASAPCPYGQNLPYTTSFYHT